MLDGFYDAVLCVLQLSWRGRSCSATRRSLACLKAPVLSPGLPEGLVGDAFGSFLNRIRGLVERSLRCFLGVPVER